MGGSDFKYISFISAYYKTLNIKVNLKTSKNIENIETILVHQCFLSMTDEMNNSRIRMHVAQMFYAIQPSTHPASLFPYAVVIYFPVLMLPCESLLAPAQASWLIKKISGGTIIAWIVDFMRSCTRNKQPTLLQLEDCMKT